MDRAMRHMARMAVSLLVAMLLLSCACVRVGVASQTATIIAKIRMFQEYKVPLSGLQNTFEYVIEPLEDDAPMPVDADGKPFSSFTLTRDEEVWLDYPVVVTVDPSATPYVYHYMIRPKQRELPDGLYYVDVQSTNLSPGVNEYPVEIHVQPSNVDAAVSIVTPTVHMEGWDDPKVADPGWRIQYQEPQEPRVVVGVPVRTPSHYGADRSSDPATTRADTSTNTPSQTRTTQEPGQQQPTNTSTDTATSSQEAATSTSAAQPAENTTATQTVTSRTPLSTTGDVQSSPLMCVCVMCSAVLIVVGATLHHRKAGEGHG